MSTGILHLPERLDLFHWSDALDPRDYVRATYLVTSVHNGDTTAIARSVGNDDYMLNVVTWLDTHSPGLQAAAGQFRSMIDAQPPVSR